MSELIDRVKDYNGESEKSLIYRLDVLSVIYQILVEKIDKDNPDKIYLDELKKTLSDAKYTVFDARDEFKKLDELIILRNLPPELSKHVKLSISKDQSICNKDIKVSYNNIARIKNNKKKINTLAKLYRENVTDNQKAALLVLLGGGSESIEDYISYNLEGVINCIKRLTLDEQYDYLIDDSKKDDKGKIEVVYDEQQKKMIEYQDNSDDKQIKREMRAYLNLYNQYYIYSTVGEKLTKFYEENHDNSRFTNVIKSILLLIQKINVILKKMKPKLDLRSELVKLLIERDEHIKLHSFRDNALEELQKEDQNVFGK